MKKLFFFLIIIIFFRLNFINANPPDRIIRAGALSEPATLDPAEAWDDTSTIHIGNIFETLVKLNHKNLQIEPGLAVSWNSRKNGTLWEFKLRKGVKFHDGTPFNADSVVFTFRRQMDKNIKYRYYDFTMFNEIFPFLKSVRKIDNFTVAFFLSKPFCPFLSALTVDCASIVSPEAVKKCKSQFRFHPVGTGPFKFEKWLNGNQISIVAYRKYWRGEPKIDKYITIFNKNLDSLINMFKSQKIDILLAYSISKMVTLKKWTWVKTLISDSFSINFIAFNMKNRFLKRIGVRRAINYLWNRNILKLVFQNHVSPLNSLFPRGITGYEKKSAKYPLSIEKARKLLKDEGLQKGFSLNMLLEKDSQLTLQLIKFFSKNLKKVGINLKIERISDEEYMKRISKGKFELAFSGWIADYPDPDSIITPLFSEKIQEQGMANLSSGEVSNIIQLIKEARREKDPEKRRKYYVNLNNIVVDRALFLPIYQDTNLILYNKRIGTIEKNPDGEINIFSLGNSKIYRKTLIPDPAEGSK